MQAAVAVIIDVFADDIAQIIGGQEWQGRCYSLKGDVTIDGMRYRDLYTATGYGTVDGLLGANCRHSFGPYTHGTKRAYAHQPKHPSGLSNDEVYKLTQKQRRYERSIRETKRELAGAKAILAKDPMSLNAISEHAALSAKLRNKQGGGFASS